MSERLWVVEFNEGDGWCKTDGICRSREEAMSNAAYWRETYPDDEVRIAEYHRVEPARKRAGRRKRGK